MGCAPSHRYLSIYLARIGVVKVAPLVRSFFTFLIVSE